MHLIGDDTAVSVPFVVLRPPQPDVVNANRTAPRSSDAHTWWQQATLAMNPEPFHGKSVLELAWVLTPVGTSSPPCGATIPFGKL